MSDQELEETSSRNGLLSQLSENSTPYRDPLTRIDWDQLNTGQYWLPPSAISLHGCQAFDTLPERQRRRLSQLEFLHMAEAGIWLEGILMSRIARATATPGTDPVVAAYRLHELREEAGHSLMFHELLTRSGLPRPETPFHRMRIANILGRYLIPIDSPLFWLAVYIGEDGSDRLNRYARNHRNEICSGAVRVMTLHMIDEARHIAHARESFSEAMAQLGPARRAAYRPLLRWMFHRFVRALYYPPARVYELAGLNPGRHWTKLALQNEHRATFVNRLLQPTMRTLRDHGFEVSWP